jgi:hypothetical protein
MLGPKHTETHSTGGMLKIRAEINNSHLFVSTGSVGHIETDINGLPKFALTLTILCQYNENKSCLSEYAETSKLFIDIWTIIIRTTLFSV